MIVIDTRNNQVHCNLSKAEIGRIVGVNRMTVLRWKKKRSEDGTHKEVYNYFEIYFNTKTYRQEKGSLDNLKKHGY